MGGGGRAIRLVAWALQADRRRPASWLAGAAAAVACAIVMLLPAGPAWLPAILAAGGVAAVAAIGDPPRGVAGPAWAWILARTAWPAAGVLGAAIVVALLNVVVPAITVPPAPDAALRSSAAAVWAWAGIAVAAVATTVAFRSGTAAGEAASLALASAAVGAGAAAGVPIPSAAARWVLGVAAAFAVPAVALAWLGAVRRRSGDASSAGAVAALLGGIAMGSTLAGMVAWLFLAPARSGRFTLLVAAWFVVLAVPQATLGCGSLGEADRRRLAWQPHPPPWRTAAFHAAVLGWPLMVAAALAGDTAAAVDRLGVAAVVALAAAVTAGATTAILAAGGTRDSALATVLGIVCLAAAAGVAAGGTWAKPGGNDVEQSRPSCKTPVSPQPAAVPPPV